MPKSLITKQIISEYNKSGSVKETARQCRSGWQRVVKILSSNGIIVSDTHAQILDLYEQGKTAEEISDRLKLSVRTVQAYLPAVRPIYGENLSPNAKRIRKCRANK